MMSYNPAKMPSSVDTAAQAIVTHFRRQRPLRGGSLIVTIFGDSLMPRGGAIALGHLIRLAEPFGLNERLVRTASARLAEDGWLETRRVGKLSEYGLSRSGHERFTEATERIYGATASWSGRWSLIVLPGLKGMERHRVRKELAWHGFGEISQGIFAHPAPGTGSLGFQDLDVSLPHTALRFVADLASDAEPRELVNYGWDLADLGKRYQRFVQRFELAATASTARSVEPKAAFIVRTLLIHEYRRLHLRDPLLPQKLLPAEWPGIRAAELCKEIYTRLFQPSEQYLSENAALLGGPLPPPNAKVLGRFGGLARQ